MRLEVLDEKTYLGKALNRYGDEVITELLKYLRKKNITLKTAIELGPGTNVLPATSLIHAGINYYGIDLTEGLFSRFKRKLVSVKTPPNVKIRLVSGDILKIDPEKDFSDIERPLLVLFYRSLVALETYADDTRRAAGNIPELVVSKYYAFLHRGDVFACFEKDAVLFYEIVKKIPFTEKILVRSSMAQKSRYGCLGGVICIK